MPRTHQVAIVLGTALLVGAVFLLEGRLLVNLTDEGFLWYGTWRTSLGEVPLRDFQSYDPGRYYWGALFAPLFGDGVLAVRASSAIFAWLGLCCGVLVLRRLDRGPVFLLSGALLLCIWILPRHKAFESALTMAATLAAVALIERPTRARHFAAGVGLGVAACFGRNHGGYWLLALCLAGGFAWWKVERRDLPRRVGAAALGFVAGYSPVLVMLAVVPGFAASYVEVVRVFVRAGATNLYRPVPWLWAVWSDPPAYLAQEGSTGLELAVITSFYTFWLPFAAAVAIAALARRRPITRPWAVLVGAVTVGLAYFHFATSRAGINHLAQSIHPMLIALIAVPFAALRSHRAPAGLAVIAALSAAGWIAIASHHPRYLVARAKPERIVSRQIGGDTLRLDRRDAASIDAIEELVRSYVPPGEPLLIVPRIPGLYALFERKAPLPEIYMTFPETQERQAAMIATLARDSIDWVLICKIPIDDDEKLYFHNSHALLYRNLMREFARVATDGRGLCELRARG